MRWHVLVPAILTAALMRWFPLSLLQVAGFAVVGSLGWQYAEGIRREALLEWREMLANLAGMLVGYCLL